MPTLHMMHKAELQVSTIRKRKIQTMLQITSGWRKHTTVTANKTVKHIL